MAYPITEEALRVFGNSYRQVADIAFYGTAQDLRITERDILPGGLSINRYSASGNRIEIGSVVAAELTLKLDNADGRFNGVTFEGAELFVQVGSKKWDAHEWENARLHWIPFGYFTIDEAPRKLQSLSLTALDRMVQFDKDADFSQVQFPISAAGLLEHACRVCNIIPADGYSLLPNANYVIPAAPDLETKVTWRQVVSWIAELTGTCGFMDWNGQLALKWYTPTGATVAADSRFQSDLNENDITITGVEIVTDNEDTFLAGNDAYAFLIQGNALIQHDHLAVAETLFNVLGGFTYAPFSATVKPSPQLYPLDMVTFIDYSGHNRTGIITDCTFTINANTKLEGKGETATDNGYATANPLTKREATIIRRIQKVQNETLGAGIQDILRFNELICNSLGLYKTSVKQSDDSTITYLHDQKKLEASGTIFTFTANGIAWTSSGWNAGSPDWQYGVTAAGNALFRKLSAEGIDVAKVGEDYHIRITPSAFQIYYHEMLVTEIREDLMQIPRVQSQQITCGKIRTVPYKNGVEEGTNLIFID